MTDTLWSRLYPNSEFHGEMVAHVDAEFLQVEPLLDADLL
jgi:hypothetical protein